MSGASGKWLASALGALLIALGSGPAATARDPCCVYEGGAGPGHGKHIVLVSGDEEYRSEELIPQLGKILAVHHGFKCTVLFAIDPKDGTINPQVLDNIPGLEALDGADLMIIFTRFRDLPDEQMAHIARYIDSGRPIIGLRTATHAFFFRKHRGGKYAKYDFRSRELDGGFGRQVLGETWIAHYGAHQRQSTRGVIAKGMEKSPLVRGCEDIWGPSDVYKVRDLLGDSQPVILGQVLSGMSPDDPPAPGKEQLPVAWTKTWTGASGKKARVFATTMGHGGDLKSEGFRRLLVNAAYWCLGMEDRIPARAKVDLVGEYEPNHIGMGRHKKGLRPADFDL